MECNTAVPFGTAHHLRLTSVTVNPRFMKTVIFFSTLQIFEVT